jgi:hypothetical protein
LWPSFETHAFGVLLRMTVVFVSAPPSQGITTPVQDRRVNQRRAIARFPDPIRHPSPSRAACAALFHFARSLVRRRARVSYARLRGLLEYDSATGEFRWLKRASRSIHVGDLAGNLDASSGYRDITIEGRSYRAHQLAWLYMTGKWCAGAIDHRDRNPSNNRWDNLRRATVSQNNANRRRHKNNACGFKGVTPIPSGRWRASIYKNRRRRHLGIFATPEAAHAAYVAAARKLFGEFARME